MPIVLKTSRKREWLAKRREENCTGRYSRERISESKWRKYCIDLCELNTLETQVVFPISE